MMPGGDGVGVIINRHRRLSSVHKARWTWLLSLFLKCSQGSSRWFYGALGVQMEALPERACGVHNNTRGLFPR